MLEREMEEAVSLYPEIFIEPHLTLIRRQIVINRRRPDVLFEDGLDRHLLVEIQRGKLDEEHLQRHIYYYFDYAEAFPDKHIRLMFIANILVPQHKRFLDAHGYEYKEIPESEFQRKMETSGLKSANAAASRSKQENIQINIEERSDLLAEIKQERMTLSYKMILLILMAELADQNGRVSLAALARRFKEFFERRRDEGKAQENPNRPGTATLANRSVEEWETNIRKMPVAHLTNRFLIDEGPTIRWAPSIWSKWSDTLSEEIRVTATMRLVEYFNRYTGGY